MRALFLTTRTVDCLNHVRAWNAAFPQAIHVAYDHDGINNDWMMVEAVERERPDVVFWIGAVKAPGNPRPAALIEMRKIAKLVNLCSDAADRPWHPWLASYRTRGCFDLQVSIDGAREAPVDLATLTPVDPAPFEIDVARDIDCGFSGNVGRWNERSETINALEWLGGLTVRRRETGESYAAHARFMRRCRMVLNLSWTGTGHAHHIKGRVLETGWAGACLLEHEDSPFAQWFPEDACIRWRDPPDVARIVREADDALIERTARRLSETVRELYRPETIYGAILDAVGHPHSRAA